MNNILKIDWNLQPAPCKGKIFRARKEIYLGSNGEYVEKKKMVPLKRKSCKGCEHCAWIEECLPEFVSDGDCLLPADFDENALYEIRVTKSYTDWETGIADDWEIGFVKVNEED